MLTPLDLPETYTTAAITVSIARSTNAGFQTAAIPCLMCDAHMMLERPHARFSKERRYYYYSSLPSINYSNEYPQSSACPSTIAAFTPFPPMVVVSTYPTAPRVSTTHLIYQPCPFSHR